MSTTPSAALLTTKEMAAELGITAGHLRRCGYFTAGVHFELQPSLKSQGARRLWKREAVIQRVAELRAAVGAPAPAASVVITEVEA